MTTLLLSIPQVLLLDKIQHTAKTPCPKATGHPAVRCFSESKIQLHFAVHQINQLCLDSHPDTKRSEMIIMTSSSMRGADNFHHPSQPELKEVKQL